MELAVSDFNWHNWKYEPDGDIEVCTKCGEQWTRTTAGVKCSVKGEFKRVSRLVSPEHRAYKHWQKLELLHQAAREFREFHRISRPTVVAMKLTWTKQGDIDWLRGQVSGYQQAIEDDENRRSLEEFTSYVVLVDREQKGMNACHT